MRMHCTCKSTYKHTYKHTYTHTLIRAETLNDLLKIICYLWKCQQFKQINFQQSNRINRCHFSTNRALKMIPREPFGPLRPPHNWNGGETHRKWIEIRRWQSSFDPVPVPIKNLLKAAYKFYALLPKASSSVQKFSRIYELESCFAKWAPLTNWTEAVLILSEAQNVFWC